MDSKNQILQDLQSIQEQFERLDGISPEVFALEHSLVLQKIGKLYETISQYSQKSSRSNEDNEKPISSEGQTKSAIEEKGSISQGKKKETNMYNAPESDIMEKLNFSKIKSLKEGISIGKRYEIQLELFNNESQAYTDALVLLENAQDLDSALSIIEQQLAPEHHWDLEHPLVEDLRNLVYRKLK